VDSFDFVRSTTCTWFEEVALFGTHTRLEQMKVVLSVLTIPFNSYMNTNSLDFQFKIQVQILTKNKQKFNGKWYLVKCWCRFLIIAIERSLKYWCRLRNILMM